ncbi:hypothetical protein [Geoalkalibacter sp.]|uniref:hypothetical protein n=1 Tax=Geoalkalibacter sp. TaxID=3041440 RepID=UPI00272E1E9A|nr:hypothetical protein [Geoalkalibacter sp.]
MSVITQTKKMRKVLDPEIPTTIKKADVLAALDEIYADPTVLSRISLPSRRTRDLSKHPVNTIRVVPPKTPIAGSDTKNDP